MATSRTWAVFKREFSEQVRTKMFIIGTLFGPVMIVAIMFLPLLFLRAGGGSERDVVIVDATHTGLGDEVATALALPMLAGGQGGPVGPGVYHTDVIDIDATEWEATRESLNQRLEAEEIDGYLYLPPRVEDDAEALYVGKTIGIATESEIRRAVQTPIQARRLDEAGISQEIVSEAMRPVSVAARKHGKEGDAANPESLFIFAQLIAFSIYLVVILYGQAVLRGVLEEKRDRIVEVVLSSVRASMLMFGKIMGIGAAGLLQMAIWTLFGAVAMTWGVDFLRERGQQVTDVVPDLGPMVAVAFLIFFFGGFLVYSALFAAVGAIATTDQEAQQLSFVPMLPLMIGFFMMFAGLTDPENSVFRMGSMVPLTSPMVMPVRVAMTDVPMGEFTLSVALLIVTVGAATWAAAKIYSIGILSTGKKPTMAEVWRWLRTA
ncbi:MAG TPA: ABC transporter permease [Longimicrobiales bacterium]|nr:ABC transporter permease [Longimicrobiales bacterium]